MNYSHQSYCKKQNIISTIYATFYLELTILILIFFLFIHSIYVLLYFYKYTDIIIHYTYILFRCLQDLYSFYACIYMCLCILYD